MSVKLNLDGAFTDENSNTKPFMVDPTTLNDGSVRATTYTTRLARDYFGGYTPIIGSWDKIELDMARPLITDNYGASAVVTWDAGPVELTSITAARWFHFDAKNDQEQTRFPIARSGTLVDTRQLSQEFRLAGDINDRIDYQTGIYLFNIDTDTTSRNTYGADAGAFYASDSQYRTLNTVAGRQLLQASLRDVYSVDQSEAGVGQRRRVRPGELASDGARQPDARLASDLGIQDQRGLSSRDAARWLGAGLDRQRHGRCHSRGADRRGLRRR